jgi:putative acetyltransferase
VVSVRAAVQKDHPAIRHVLASAFGRDDEGGIVEAVRAEGADLVELVAERAGSIVGCVLLSRMTSDARGLFAGLGPVAVLPEHQNTGAGSAVCQAGLAACRDLGVSAVVVLGHPGYYPRFGFSMEAAQEIASPHAGKPAFMAMALSPGALERPLRLDYPAAFG